MMQESDKRRVNFDPNRKVKFREREEGFMPDFDRITSVTVVPLLSGQRVACAKLSRGLDLPGGHVHASEHTIEETARREVLEEVGIDISQSELRVISVIESDYFGSSPKDLTYLVAIVTLVDERSFREFAGNEESSGREVVTIQEFLQRYTAGDRDDMRRLLEKAVASIECN